MTPEERERMLELCRKIQTEIDQHRFSESIYELSCLLGVKRDELSKEPSDYKKS